jgi:hypothetical protein
MRSSPAFRPSPSATVHCRRSPDASCRSAPLTASRSRYSLKTWVSASGWPDTPNTSADARESVALTPCSVVQPLCCSQRV